jgi:glycine/sarcosine N-methyltransferase
MTDTTTDPNLIKRITAALTRSKPARWLMRVLRRRVVLQLLLAAGIAVGIVAIGHAIGVRVRGENGDAVVAIPALIAAYFLLDWVLPRLPRPRVVPRVAGTWLRIREKNPTIAEGAATIIFTALLDGLLRAAKVTVPGKAGGVVIAIAAFIVAYLFVSQITNLMVGTLVRKVHSIGAAAQGDARATILAFVDRHLDRLDDEIKDILSEKGAALDAEDVRFWTEQSFALGRGRYDGTDSHLPSAFQRLYPNYLRAHGEMLQVHPQPEDKPNYRILIGFHRDFRDDFIDSYDEGYKGFLDWHDDKKVKLYHLEREQADHIRSYISKVEDQKGLPTSDIAIWYGQYALLFREEPGSEGATIRLWMVFPGHRWYAECVNLIDVMLHGEKPNGHVRPPAAVPLGEAVPEIFQRDLCRNWAKFVNPDKRMVKLGPFFEYVLEKDKEGGILDAAAGIGSDALWLSQRGYNVTVNEIEPVYRELIERRFGEAGRALRLFGADWRKLYETMGRWFSAVLVLGNSLCLLKSPDQQLRAVREFHDVLLPGGHLVIDERNYEHFTAGNVAGQIAANPIRNFPFKGEILYCGDEVKGCPKRIEAEDVVFRYYRNDENFQRRMEETDVLNDALRRELDKRELGVLHLYPFKKGQLGDLLVKGGFTNIKVYRDLDWTQPYDFVADDWFDLKADFFTYVAEKPRTSDETGTDIQDEAAREHAAAAAQ